MGEKSRGGWQIGWCPKTECKHHGIKKICDDCFWSERYEVEDVKRKDK